MKVPREPTSVATGADARLSRELGVRQLAAGIFNYTVASGIFALPAVAVAQLGPAAPVAYVACAMVMALVVLCFAEAGSRVSATGGPYAYVAVALGPFVGFMAGALLWLTDVSGTAAVATLFAASATRLGGGGRLAEAILVVAVFGALALVNVRGVRTGARLVEAATVAKLVPLVALVVAGLAFMAPEHLAWEEAPRPRSVLATAGVLIFAFAGIEAALLPSGEVREPSRTVPRAALLALAGTTLLYVAVQVAAQGVLGPQLVLDRTTPLAAVAERIAGAPGRRLLLAGAAVSMFGYLCGAVLAGPRSLFAFGRDRFLPAALASVHPRFRTPHVAIVSYVLLAGGLALSGTFERLAALTSVTVLTLYFLCAIAAWRLRRRDVRTDGEPFRVPGGALVPLLAAVATLGVLAVTATGAHLVGVGGVLAAGAVLYALRAMRGRGAARA